MPKPKRIAIDCPHCKRSVTVRASFTRPQTRVIKELASGQHDTQIQAAQAAGVHPVTVSKLLSEPNIALAVVVETAKRSDNARDSLSRIAKVKEKAWSKLAELDVETMTPADAGLLAKLAGDAHKVELDIRAMTGDSDSDSARDGHKQLWVKAIGYAVAIAYRAGRRRLRIDDSIPTRVEKRLLRDH